jgi:alpha-L-arabinofuranosidase
VRLDRAWKAVETNQVGTDEFLRWVRGLGAEPMLAVNPCRGQEGCASAREMARALVRSSGTSESG